MKKSIWVSRIGLKLDLCKKPIYIYLSIEQWFWAQIKFFFDKLGKLGTSYNHQNNFKRTLSPLILIFHLKGQWVEQSDSRLLFRRTECMLGFTKVQINVHKFNLHFSIIHNHDGAYEDQELLHYLEPWILFM